MFTLKRSLCVLTLTVAATAAHADVVVVMSAKSPVSTLTQAQVSDIFLGKASTFPQGGQAVPIDLASGAPNRDEFYTKVTGRTAVQLKSYWAKQSFSGKGTAPKAVAGDDELKKLIAANPNTIGYIDKTRLDASVKAVFAP
jgi:ABC-type phosphate transport system substrate-binding protein